MEGDLNKKGLRRMLSDNAFVTVICMEGDLNKKGLRPPRDTLLHTPGGVWKET